VRRGVDEVAEGDESGGESNGGPVEGGDEDFGMRVEGVGYVEVVGDEGTEPVTAQISTLGHFAGDGDVRTSGYLDCQRPSPSPSPSGFG